MTHRAEALALWRLSWPIAFAQVASMLMGVVDTLFAGPLGTEPLAALAIGNISFFALFVLGVGTVRSLDAYVSQAWGRGDREDAARGLSQAHWLALLVSVPIGALVLAVPSALQAIGYSPALVAGAAEYVRPLVWGIPGGVLFGAYRSYLAATGVTRPMIVGALLANGANLLLDMALVDGKWGAPALGVTGIAWSTSFCRYLMLGVLVLAARWHGEYEGMPSAFRRPEPRLIAHLFSIGLPVGLSVFAEVSAFAGAGVLMGLVGADALAAHQVALNVTSLLFMVPLGLASGAAVRCGRALGARDVRGVARAGNTALAVAGGYALVSASLLLLLREPVARLYGIEGEVLSLTVVFLGVAALFQLGDCLQVMSAGMLRGLGDTSVPMLYTLLGYGGVALPMGYLGTFVLADDPIWLWYGLTAGLGLVAVLNIARFRAQLRRLAPLS